MSGRPKTPGPSREDILHLQAAEGWLGLSDHVSANAELDAITPALLADPAVLCIRWQVHSMARNWDMALEIATELTRRLPDHPQGWIHRSYALHELKRTAEARDNLVTVIERFKEPVMFYNLACYECRLGNLSKSLELLAQTFALRGGKKFRQTALEDPDLQPIRERITELS